ncbi:hypothetical protein [Carnimonas bestiolae]|uniref:hypothetical protein n=1 Tax=Carnimonas bestiolae TaxID=3402172 RepID=UPI003F4AA409
MPIIKCAPWLIVAMLAVGCWHYRGSASDWQRTSQQQEYRADTAETANSSLMTANAALDARNTSLLESLNARTQQREQQRKRADANRRAYDAAVAGDADWANTRVPDSVVRSLRP